MKYERIPNWCLFAYGGYVNVVIDTTWSVDATYRKIVTNRFGDATGEVTWKASQFVDRHELFGFGRNVMNKLLTADHQSRAFKDELLSNLDNLAAKLDNETIIKIGP